MPKRTKKPVTKTKSKTLEIPITALPPETMPDGELGRQWNELYPPGTEVIVDDCKTTEPNVKSSRLARTAAPAVHDYKRNAGLRDCLRLDGDITDISLRNFIFPASAFPELTKELRNKQDLQIRNGGKKNWPITGKKCPNSVRRSRPISTCERFVVPLLGDSIFSSGISSLLGRVGTNF